MANSNILLANNKRIATSQRSEDGNTVHHQRVEVPDYLLEVLKSRVPGSTIIHAFGERESMGAGAAGEDIWRGTAVAVPTPDADGEQMTLVSTDAGDIVDGTGVRKVRLVYIQAETGLQLSEVVSMNGLTPVDTVATDIKFVQRIHATENGATGVADGVITIYKKGAASTVYSIIDAGGNMSMVPVYMVPTGKTLYVMGWHASEAQNKRLAFRLRATCEEGVLYPGTFLFKDVVYLNGNPSGWRPAYFVAPAGAIVKVTGWGDQTQAEGSCGWVGELVDD